MGEPRAVRGWLGLVLLAAALGGCGGVARVPAPVSDPAARAAAAPAAARATRHVVRSGETLYAIAWRYGVDYRRLASWNGLLEPYLIRPGQVLRVDVPERGEPRRMPPGAGPGDRPAAPARAAPRSSGSPAGQAAKSRAGAGGDRRGPAAPAEPRPSPGATAPPAAARAPLPRAARPAPPRRGPLRWQWPAKGRVIGGFGRGGRKGIDIAGRTGSPVRAAAAGKVVYRGSGLIGYGKLIIVKHDERFLSAYAHNDKVLVREGDTVKAGQRIATMGRSGTDRTKLHFEIRRDGKPVDPLRYLPR